MSYTASLLDGTPLGVVEFEALSSSLLVLERTFQTTNTIRLYEAAPSDGVFDKKMLIEWDVNGMRNGDGSKISDLQVDNYEGMCLCPDIHGSERRLILVNDDNDNMDQIGTQFVLLALSTGSDTVIDSNRGYASFRLFLIVVAIGSSIAVCCAGIRYEVRRRKTPHISGDPGVMLSNLRFDADLVIPPRLTVPARSMARSNQKKKGYEKIGRQESGEREPAMV